MQAGREATPPGVDADIASGLSGPNADLWLVIAVAGIRLRRPGPPPPPPDGLELEGDDAATDHADHAD